VDFSQAAISLRRRARRCTAQRHYTVRSRL
jgi:hypothetical protein